MWYAAHLQLDQALVEAHTALELDPASISVRRTVAWVYYYGRRFEQAREHITRAIAMNPMAEENYWILGLVLSQMGEWNEAERVLREGLRYADLGTYSQATLGYVLARAGRRAEAEEILAGFEERARSGYVSPVAYAIVHIGLGNLEKALDAADRACAEHRGWVVYLRVNPLVHPIRNEPRFKAIIERLGL